MRSDYLNPLQNVPRFPTNPQDCRYYCFLFESGADKPKRDEDIEADVTTKKSSAAPRDECNKTAD